MPLLISTFADMPPDRPSSASKLLGDDADRLDRFERRDVRGDVRQPEVVRDGAFDADRVGVLRRAVGAEDEAARRIHRDRMHVLRRRDAGDMTNRFW